LEIPRRNNEGYRRNRVVRRYWFGSGRPLAERSTSLVVDVYRLEQRGRKRAADMRKLGTGRFWRGLPNASIGEVLVDLPAERHGGVVGGGGLVRRSWVKSL
jgi:hypothetical protein